MHLNRPKLLVLLFSGILFLLLSHLLAITSGDWHRGSEEREIINQAQANVNNWIGRVAKQEKSLVNHIESKEDFQLSQKRDSYDIPTRIYKNKVLLFWSDNNFYPEYDLIKNISNIDFIKTNAGKYLIFKRSVFFEQNAYEIYSFIRLTYKYPFRNKYLKPGLNPSIFPASVIAVNKEEAENRVCSNDGRFLFSIEIEQHPFTNDWKLFLVTLTFIMGLSLLLAFTLYLVNKYHQRRQYEIAFLSILLLSITIKVLIVLFHLTNIQNFNNGILELNIIGIVFSTNNLDLLIDAVLIFPNALYILFVFPNLKIIKYFVARIKDYPNTGQAFLYAIHFIFAYLFYSFLKTIFQNEDKFVRLFLLEDVDAHSLLSLSGFIISVSIFFIGTHLTGRIGLVIHSMKNKKGWIFPASFFLALILLGYFLKRPDIPFVCMVSFTYLQTIIRMELPLSLKRIRYLTYLYFFIGSFQCAVLGAYAIYEMKGIKIDLAIKALAEKINHEEGPIDVGLLSRISERIKNDLFVKSSFTNPFYDKKAVEHKITRIFIKDNFDKFDCNIYLFDENGNCLNKSIKRNYISYFNRYNKQKYRTPYNGVFQISGPKPVYYSFIKVWGANNSKAGYITLEFKTENNTPNSVFPELLLDRNHINHFNDQYSYAVYKANNLLYSEGDFNYYKYYSGIDDNERNELQSGLVKGHVLNKLFSYPAQRDILIGTEEYNISKVFSDFSFLFLLQAIVIAFFVVGNTFYYKLTQVSNTFTTKVQLFINFAFFLPLVVVSITTYGIISDSYQQELQNNFIKKARNISENAVNPLTDYNHGKASINEINVQIRAIEKFAETDINVYNKDGSLIASTQPRIFETPLLSKYINRSAYEDITFDREPYKLVQESIGSLKYNIVYYPIKSYDTGALAGILSIPYFESKRELEQKVLDVLTFVLNIFTVIFILFLGLSYFASAFLTVPLTLLTNKLKQTNLNQLNEPLIYKANDEIGFMVKEYNKMLINLEGNKNAIRNNEKETAWREMARQVAHEIKNPLTPMKLTLQNMQRLLKYKDEETKKFANRSIDVLLEQVDNLSDIASSFSSFTQMPMPKKESVDMVGLLTNIVFLFENKKDSKIHYTSEKQYAYIMGDEKLLARIFINLLTNAFESIPYERIPEIHIKLNGTANKSIRVSVCDNGSGIPTAILDKVFELNFSTKSVGYGIGLVIAKRGIEQMEGRIWFETTLDMGTCFFIELPLTDM